MSVDESTNVVRGVCGISVCLPPASAETVRTRDASRFNSKPRILCLPSGSVQSVHNRIPARVPTGATNNARYSDLPSRGAAGATGPVQSLRGSLKLYFTMYFHSSAGPLQRVR